MHATYYLLTYPLDLLCCAFLFQLTLSFCERTYDYQSLKCLLKNDAAFNIRVQVTEVLRRARLPRSNLSKNQKDAVQNLRTDKSIHILKADKGNTTVLLNRTDYDKKILALLSTPTYKELKRDPTASI